jgi:hypothetical protein
MSKQMKELDKNHFEIVQLATWKSEDWLYFSQNKVLGHELDDDARYARDTNALA